MMERHPARLIILWPMWKIEGCRSILHAMDDGLVVHHQPDGRFALQQYPMYQLVSRGRNSALSTLVRIASALDGGYRLVIVDEARFLPELINLARARDSQNARNDIDCALQAIDGQAAAQLTDHLFEASSEYMMGRALLGMRERRTRPYRHEMTGLTLMGGVVTPRSEQLWHSLRHEWCSPRLQQAGHRAWIKWCLQNRPPIARSVHHG